MERAIKQGDRRLAIGLTAMALALGAALPAGASQHEGVIDATVTVVDAPEACILLSTTALDFGELDFGDTTISSPYAVEKCAEAPQDLYVMGTDADLGIASWQLADPTAAPLGVNEYALDAWSYAIGDDTILSASTANLLVSDMPESSSFDHRLLMPPIGSDGAGQVASFQIIWIAVLSG